MSINQLILIENISIEIFFIILKIDIRTLKTSKIFFSLKKEKFKRKICLILLKYTSLFNIF